MSLKEKALSMNSGKGIEFMEGRTKGEMETLLEKTITIRDYAFISGTEGEYAVFIIDEDPTAFYFGGKVLTDNLKSLNEEDHEELKAEGLPAFISQRISKNKRKYISVEFYPEV